MPRGFLRIFFSLSHVILKAGIISPFTDEKNRLRDLSPRYPSLLCVLRHLLQSQGLIAMSYASDSQNSTFSPGLHLGKYKGYFLFDLSAAFVRVSQGLLLDFHGTALSFASCPSLVGSCAGPFSFEHWHC